MSTWNWSKSGFIPIPDDEPTPTMYLAPPRMATVKWSGDLQSFKDSYFDHHIEALRTAWVADCFPPSQLISEARKLCREHERQEPDWIQTLVDRAIQPPSEASAKRGRQARAAGLERDRASDFVRWSYACTALKMRTTLPMFGYPATREGVWEFVHLQLIGTPAQGSPGAVERSYKRVRRAILTAKNSAGPG